MTRTPSIDFSKKYDNDDVIAETTVVWDRDSGQPLCNAIVWLDTRTSQLAAEYIDRTETK